MDISRYLAEEGKKIDLTQWSTTCDVDIDKKKVKGELLDQTISEMQDLQDTTSVLLCFELRETRVAPCTPWRLLQCSILHSITLR